MVLLDQSVLQLRGLEEMSVVAFEGAQLGYRHTDFRLPAIAFDSCMAKQSTYPIEVSLNSIAEEVACLFEHSRLNSIAEEVACLFEHSLVRRQRMLVLVAFATPGVQTCASTKRSPRFCFADTLRMFPYRKVSGGHLGE